MRVLTARAVVTVLLGVALVATSGVANAGPISWGPAFELKTVSDLDFSGDNIQAVNGGADIGLVVGGVTFDGYGVTANFQDVNAEPSWITAALETATSHNAPRFRTFPASATGGGFYTVVTDDPVLDTLLETHAFGTADRVIAFTLSGLTIGQQYRLQIVGQPDTRNGDNLHTLDVGNGDGGTGVVVNRFADLDGDGTSNVTTAIGTFIATSDSSHTAGLTTQSFTTGPNSNGGGFGALVLSEIPEPSTAFLGIFGATSLAALRRRRMAF